MKKNYIYKCIHCDFKTNEKNKKCPICNNEMEKVEGEKININPTLPDKITNEHHEDVEMGYYCFKCHKKMKTKVCLDCNNVGSLYIETNENRAIIKRINRLTDHYDNEEMQCILNELTEQEKVYIYHNYESAHRFFYKKDINKSIVCFIFALIFYFVFLDITFNMSEQNYIFVSYLFNTIANTMIITLMSLGVWYLLDATNVEFMKIPIKVGIITIIPNIIQLAFCIAKDCDITKTLISGFIAMGLSVVINIIYIIWELKHEK